MYMVGKPGQLVQEKAPVDNGLHLLSILFIGVPLHAVWLLGTDIIPRAANNIMGNYVYFCCVRKKRKKRMPPMHSTIQGKKSLFEHNYSPGDCRVHSDFNQVQWRQCGGMVTDCFTTCPYILTMPWFCRESISWKNDSCAGDWNRGRLELTVWYNSSYPTAVDLLHWKCMESYMYSGIWGPYSTVVFNCSCGHGFFTVYTK